MCTIKYNKSKIKGALEDKKEASRCWDHQANQEKHMDHSYVISSLLPLSRVLHNLQWVVHIFSLRWAIWSCTYWSNISSNSRVWVLETNCEHLTIETLLVVYKFSTIVLKILYTKFLSGPPDNPASNHKFR